MTAHNGAALGSTSTPRPDTAKAPNNDGSDDSDVTPDTSQSNQKAKKKKKRKTPAQKRAAAQAALEAAQAKESAPAPVLKISRNKHMKYISSFHGPWLQLPHEILESFLHINCDDTSSRMSRNLIDARASVYAYADRSRYRALPPPPVPIQPGLLTEDEERSIPPAVDPAAFRGVTEIRKLVDEAAELATRASSGLSAAALGSFNGSLLGGDGFGGPGSGAQNGIGGNGRNSTMSPVRQHRLRSLAVSKLAQAYAIDEIAASVCIMQSATGLDDLSQRVLKHDPSSTDAQYVHFFHEKIPSRTLATSTDTDLLDDLILRNPNNLEYYRTRGVVHGFKQDYSTAIRGYTQALQQAKATRKAKQHHSDLNNGRPRKGRNGKGPGGSKRKTKLSRDTDSPDEGPPNDTTTSGHDETADNIGNEPGDDLERQILFHRGMAYFHWACKMLEDTALDIEGIEKPIGGLSNEGGELTLRNVGIVLNDEQAGLYGNATPDKAERYRNEFTNGAFKERVCVLLRRSLRDMERFLSYFTVWEAPRNSVTRAETKTRYQNPRSTDKPLTFRGRRLIHHRALSNRARHADPRRQDLLGPTGQPEVVLLTTYHPLLVEAHFTVLLTLLLLGDFTSLITAHARTVRLMDYLEGYPIFLPARSLNQSEYAEVLERLATVWLQPREDNQGKTAPTGSETDIATDRGDLECLHHVLSFFTPAYVQALVSQAERDEQRLRDEVRTRKSNLVGATSKLAITDGTSQGQADHKSSWAEERDKADAERRKIDPSYATYNTARAEVALAWLTVAILPDKESEDQAGASGKVKGKGKGKAAQPGDDDDDNMNAPVASTSKHEAGDED
ncbi:hypothetical protein OIO90_000532 [Microbotryomycetes sp. JL221]|nr:hypothetical protein OIO90_000532 [Microbotryomycetes sp. JL221]